MPGFSKGGSNAGVYIQLLISAVSVVFKALNFQLQCKHTMRFLVLKPNFRQYK
jgi:hypothetical protein